MKFQNGYIENTPYWGLFQNRRTAQNVINDLQIALGKSTEEGSQSDGDYVIAFLFNGDLYVSRRNYYALVVDIKKVHHVKDTYETIPVTENSVLAISDGYLDDLPKFKSAEQFCQVMSEIPVPQYCIPLNGYHFKAALESGNIFNTIKYNDYHKVSPFELKNTLITKAQQSDKPFLNVGRGNPNFVNTTGREAFAHLLSFASVESTNTKTGDVTDNPAIGFAPAMPGISKRLDKYTATLKDRGGKFLKEAVGWMRENSIINDPDDLVHQMTIAALGSFYPDPPQVQPFVSAVMNAYMDYILLHSERPRGKFDVFMTEGATAGIMYTFKSLRINGLLSSGDHIAIITPIFTPYLELPELSKYDLKEVYITGDPNNDWKVPPQHLEVLRDKKIKALFLVNPTNPGAVSMTKEHVAKIGDIVRTDNPDLLVIADSVYAPFVESYNSFMSEIPENTIEMYSFSKYFGVTGWRMGMIVMHPENIVDKKLLPNLSNRVKKDLDKRYSIVTETGQENLTFMQRLVLDSRDVAEAHTGGLATPQQTLMSLFAVYDMTHKDYKPAIKDILVKRIQLLYKELDMTPPLAPDDTDYYTIIDIKKLAVQRHGNEFVKELVKRDCLEFVFRLAIDYATIALPIAGFHGPCWAIRISLANAPTDDYLQVGKNIVAVLDDMYKAYG